VSMAAALARSGRYTRVSPPPRGRTRGIALGAVGKCDDANTTDAVGTSSTSTTSTTRAAITRVRVSMGAPPQDRSAETWPSSGQGDLITPAAVLQGASSCPAVAFFARICDITLHLALHLRIYGRIYGRLYGRLYGRKAHKPAIPVLERL